MNQDRTRAKEVHLSEVTDSIQYGYTAQSSPSGKGPKYLRITDIQKDQVDWAQVPHVAIEASDRDRYALDTVDIVFARTGATVGKSFFIRSDSPSSAIFASYLIRVRCNKALLEPQYAAYFFKSNQYWQQIREGASGTGQPNFNGTKLANLLVPLWHLSEQRRIVAKLDSLFNRSKNARDELSRIPQLIDRYKHAVLAAAFRGALTAEWREQHPALSTIDHTGKAPLDAEAAFKAPYELPATWTWLALPKLGVLDRGRSRHRPRNAPELFGGPYPFVQTGDIKAAQGLLLNFEQTYSETGLAQSRLWPKGTVCITIAANIAESAVLGIEACFPDSIVGFTPTPTVCESHFIELFIRTIKDHLAAFAPATAQKNINLETLRRVHVPCPPLEEQHEIVRRARNVFSRLDQLGAEAIRATVLLDRLDQAVLSKAFGGQLVPPHPNDELVSFSGLDTDVKVMRETKPLRAKSIIRPRVPKEKAAMTKGRYDNDVNGKPYLAGILRTLGTSASVEELFKRSELPVADFYKQLSWEVDGGLIRDDHKRLEPA